MQSKVAFAILASNLAYLVSAVPSNASHIKDVPLTTDVNGHVYVCTDANWGGDCVNYGITLGQCSNFPSAFQGDISCFGPDNGLNCCIYVGDGCSSKAYNYCYTYPGIPDLSQVGGGYINDKASSVLCNEA